MADNVTQQIPNCLLIYDLTGHSISVMDSGGQVRLKIWRMPDTPGGFDISANNDHSVEVHNPNGVNFHPMHDAYEDNQALYG